MSRGNSERLAGSTEPTMTLEQLRPFVSTGQLPSPELVRKLVDEAYERFASVGEGEPSQVYPALAAAAPELFGICVVGARGNFYGVGDVEVEFTIMSVAKPFVFALVCAALGPEEMRRRIGVNATGLAFNSLTAIEQGDEGRTNPLVNSGAIATAALVPGTTTDDRWIFIVDGLSRFAGRSLSLDEDVFRSASETNYVNRSIANLLESRGALALEPAEAVDLYTRQSSLAVTARDLATMGATLALGGVNPLTRERVVDEDTCRYVLAVMTTAGLYENSGDWLYEVGLPGKSGIGGGIVTVAPGKGGLATFAPPLDRAGNSVRGQLATRFLSRALGLDIFMSRTEDAGTDT
jgi:glutaminase